MTQPQPSNDVGPRDGVVVSLDSRRRGISIGRTVLATTDAAGGPTADVLLTIIGKLLDDTGVALERDRHTARACIARAAALVRAERDRDAFTRPKCALAAWQVKRLTAFVDANLGGTIAAEDLTELVQMSTGHFFRSFKRSFGETPFSFIARRRMLRAQELMLATDEPLSQIAIACGLCDQSHFTRVFRRIVGETPNAWRRRVAVAQS